MLLRGFSVDLFYLGRKIICLIDKCVHCSVRLLINSHSLSTDRQTHSWVIRFFMCTMQNEFYRRISLDETLFLALPFSSRLKSPCLSKVLPHNEQLGHMRMAILPATEKKYMQRFGATTLLHDFCCCFCCCNC